MEYDRLRKFRQETHQMLGKAKDATLELMDSVMTTRNASCLGEFALSPLFRRKWSSTYEALQDSRPNRNKLIKRYIEEMPSSEYILLGIDHTAWGRRGAKTLKDRTYEHQASSNKSVTVGQGYSTIAWLPENQGSWALPLRHERITSYEKPISKAAWQLQQVSRQIKPKVLVVLDSEYGNGSWVNQTGGIPVSKLMRIRSNYCLWSKPKSYSGFGRAKKHDQKFKVNDLTTWSDLMPLMTWQLWLALDLVEDNHLPWQSPQKNLTPGRVAQSIFSLLVEIGSPTLPAKPRGKSPGWKQGEKRRKRKTYPIAKKSYSRVQKSKKEVA